MICYFCGEPIKGKEHGYRKAHQACWGAMSLHAKMYGISRQRLQQIVERRVKASGGTRQAALQAEHQKRLSNLNRVGVALPSEPDEWDSFIR